jgi:hypothetical protein
MENLGRTGNSTWNRTTIFAVEVVQPSSLCSVKDYIGARCVAGCIFLNSASQLLSVVVICYHLNPSNAALNPMCHLLTLLGAHHILHVSRRVKD